MLQHTKLKATFLCVLGKIYLGVIEVTMNNFNVIKHLS